MISTVIYYYDSYTIVVIVRLSFTAWNYFSGDIVNKISGKTIGSYMTLYE